MEFDPNSALNKNFEVFKSYFTHKFPQYLSQNIKNIFACNQIQPQELDDISFSDEEFEESIIESDENSENSSKSLKIKTIEINQDYDNDSKEEEVIELALLNEPEIPLIDQLSIQKIMSILAKHLKRKIKYYAMVKHVLSKMKETSDEMRRLIEKHDLKDLEDRTLN